MRGVSQIGSQCCQLNLFDECQVGNTVSHMCIKVLQTSPTLKDTGLVGCSCLLGADDGREDELD